MNKAKRVTHKGGVSNNNCSCLPGCSCQFLNVSCRPSTKSAFLSSFLVVSLTPFHRWLMHDQSKWCQRFKITAYVVCRVHITIIIWRGKTACTCRRLALQGNQCPLAGLRALIHTTVSYQPGPG